MRKKGDIISWLNAEVAELADAQDLGSCEVIPCGSSTLPLGTTSNVVAAFDAALYEKVYGRFRFNRFDLNIYFFSYDIHH